MFSSFLSQHPNRWANTTVEPEMDHRMRTLNTWTKEHSTSWNATQGTSTGRTTMGTTVGTTSGRITMGTTVGTTAGRTTEGTTAGRTTMMVPMDGNERWYQRIPQDTRCISIDQALIIDAIASCVDGEQDGSVGPTQPAGLCQRFSANPTSSCNVGCFLLLRRRVEVVYYQELNSQEIP